MYAPPVVTQTTMVAPTATTNAISDLMPPSQMIANGTELMSDIYAGPLACDGLFHVIGPCDEQNGNGGFDGFPLNPADTTTAPRSTALAAQFTKFVCNGIRLNFMSSSSSQIPGNVHFCAVADPTTEAPKDVGQMAAMGNYISFQIFNVNENWVIPNKFLNQAYKNLTVQKPKTGTDVTPTNTAGKVFVAIDGINSATGVSVGKLYWSYSWKLTIPKQATGANDADAVYISHDATPGSVPIRFTDADIATNMGSQFKMLHVTSTAGTYQLRVKNQSQECTLYSENNVNTIHLVSVSRDAVNWTALTVTAIGTGFSTRPYTQFIIPAGYRYVKFAYSVANTPACACLHIKTRSN